MTDSPLMRQDNTPLCPKCGGSGRYRDPRIWGTMPGSTTCPDCDGTGVERLPQPHPLDVKWSR